MSFFTTGDILFYKIYSLKINTDIPAMLNICIFYLSSFCYYQYSYSSFLVLNVCISETSHHHILNFTCTYVHCKHTCIHAKSLQSCPTLCYPMITARLLCPWDSPNKNTGMGCHALLLGIFLTQGSNPHLLGTLHW